MVISSTEAAEALRDIAQTIGARGSAAPIMSRSPHSFSGGLIWAAGYTGCGLTPPEQMGPGLVAADPRWRHRRDRARRGAPAAGERRGRPASSGFSSASPSPSALAIALFIGATYFVFQPVTPLPYLVFPALITALIYVLLGALLGLPRYTAIGAIMFLVTMAGFVYAKAYLPFWIAAAGGGGLILGGLWMRKV